jgi:beta-lactamase superfamily II metal-dependent hydrolase
MVVRNRRIFLTGKTAITVDFTFHNVGEGLFYTGKIHDFNFIYDCGAQYNRKHLNSVVDDYVTKQLRTAKVDLLILSHLHDDHVAGLDALFNKVSVDTVMLPYLSPLERLIVALRRSNLPPWFYRFWADPITFLIEKGTRKVILIGGREPYSPDSVPTREERSENEEEKLDLSDMPEDEYLRKEVLDSEKDKQQLERFFNQQRLFTRNHAGYLKAKGIWFFRFFNCRVKDSKANSFMQCIKPVIQGDDLVEVIKSKSRLQSLRSCYKSLQGDFNDTSLLVYHAPITIEKLETYSFPCVVSICLDHRFGTYLHGPAGQFLTGDINLNKKLAEIEKHYGGHLSEVGLALVPHHGSRNSWNGTILTKITRKCSWVTSAGISNKHHPSSKVTQDIIRNRSALFCSNELDEVSIRGFLNKNSERKPLKG